MTNAVSKPTALIIDLLLWCVTLAVYLSRNNLLHTVNDYYMIDSQGCSRTNMGYSRDQLLDLRQTVSPSYRLPTTTWQNIRNLGICRTPRTHRGNRGGKHRHQNQLVVDGQRIETRPTCSSISSHQHNDSFDTTLSSPNSQHFSLAVWNARSIRNKTTMCSSYILENSIDLMFITESWLCDTGRDDVIMGEVTPPSYTFFNIPRVANPNNNSESNGGGGIAAIAKEGLGLQLFPTGRTFSTFEHACFTDMSKSVYFFVIYRPPPSSENGLKTSDFLIEFDMFIESVNFINNKVLIVGDFNVHVDLPTKHDASCLLTTLATTGLVQHVSGPTHKHGHTLDLVISRDSENLITDCKIDSRLSDHNVIVCHLNLLKPKPAKTVVKTRNLREINLECFQSDLLSQFESHSCTTVDDLVELYQTTVSQVLDKHAPVETIERTCRPRQPWYNSEIHDARRLRRKYERKWRKSKLDVDRQLYVDQRELVNNMTDKAKQDYYKNELDGADSKSVFKTVNKLLNKNKKVLPVHSNASDLANEFGSFFANKVAKIYDGIESDLGTYVVSDCVHVDDSSILCHNLVNFDLVSEDDIMKYVMKTPAKSCLLDPIPTWYLKQNATLFVPVLTDIVNFSLSTGKFPDQLKHAIISPVIKKQNLDANELKNFRPVSNIPYLSKIIERHAVDNISSYLSVNNLGEPLQSAYKPAHSTESALLKVKNDIMEAVSHRKGVFLALLDLSAAFDTVNHNILLSRLANDFGIQGNVLQWISSYLSGRTTSVCVDGVFSQRLELKYGLPQGSIVGPQQFTIYTTPIGHILRNYNLSYHIYADDIQIYCQFDPLDQSSILSALSLMSACIDEIKQWMTSNYLKFNEEKTEFFIAIADHLKCHVPPVNLRVGSKVIPPSDSVRNLGLVFDSSMTMSSQITSLCTSLNFQLRTICRIRKYLDQDNCHLIIRALVLSRLDYCNSLLYGCKTTDLHRLQRIQNWAAKLTCCALKRDHATPYLRELHWLPVQERISFKILVYVYKCINELAPGYLTSCLTLYRPARSGLRSASDTTRLIQPNTIRCLQSASNRTFSNCAPQLWNSLAQSIRTSPSLIIFKKALKKHLYPF